MNKDELFDASTIMDLDTYGIVMARGGAEGLENSFQIWANTQPKFLDAAKSIIIDRSIEQKKYVDNGNKLVPDANIQQKVYNNYFFMLPFYYASKGWCTDDNNYHIEKISYNKCKKTNEKNLNNNKYIIKGRQENTYYPSKIIDAPPSQFGGQPEIFNPKKFNLLNYPTFDNYFLQAALNNNNDKALEKIKKYSTKEELIKVLITPDEKNNLALITALDKNMYFIKDLIDNNLLKYLPGLLENEIIERKFKSLLERKFENSFDDFDSDTLEIMLKVFSSNDKLKNIFFAKFELYSDIIDELNLADFNEILQKLNLIKDENFMIKLTKILKIKNEKNQNYFHRKIFIPGKLDNFKNATDGLEGWKSTFINYPSLLIDILNEIDTSNENLTSLQQRKLNAIKELQNDLNTLAK